MKAGKTDTRKEPLNEKKKQKNKLEGHASVGLTENSNYLASSL